MFQNEENNVKVLDDAHFKELLDNVDEKYGLNTSNTPSYTNRNTPRTDILRKMNERKRDKIDFQHQLIGTNFIFQ